MIKIIKQIINLLKVLTKFFSKSMSDDFFTATKTLNIFNSKIS